MLRFVAHHAIEQSWKKSCSWTLEHEVTADISYTFLRAQGCLRHDQGACPHEFVARSCRAQGSSAMLRAIAVLAASLPEALT